MTFRVITPLEITDTILIGSNIQEPEPGEVEWDESEVVTLGSLRYKNHIVYEALTDGESGNDPTDEVQNDVDNPPEKWLEIGRTNRWTMFNLDRSDQSVTSSPFTFSFRPGTRTNSLGLFGLSANSINIVMTIDAKEVFNYIENLNTRTVTNYYEYCYEPFTTKPSTVVFDMPPITGAEITVTLISNSGTVKCASVALGNNTNLGNVVYGAESDVLNFSRIDRAFDGTALLKRRRSIPKVNVDVVANKMLTNKIRSVRTNLNAVPAVWAGIDQTDDKYFESLLVLGVYKKFKINIENKNETLVEVEIEEI